MSRLMVALSESMLSRFLCEAQLRTLAEHLQLQQFEAGETVMARGGTADFVALLLSGELDILSGDRVVATLSSGRFFGESMFSEQPIRTADVKAAVRGTFALLTLESFERLLKRDRQTALRCKGLFAARYGFNRDRLGCDRQQYVALITHHGMMPVLADFAKTFKERLSRYPLVATGKTGAVLYRAAGLLVARRVQSSLLGGDQVIGSMIASGNIRAIIFFRDPLSAQPHYADIRALERLSDVYCVPFATNPVMAEAVLDYLEREEPSRFAFPGFSQHR